MRIGGLDFLRGLAILLVLFRHSWYLSVLHFIGWIGVDLFFVLSGFLVSGLLFKEYLIDKDVKVKIFLIRRGFKIYPSFYFFIITCVFLKYILTGTFYPGNQLLAEIFYLQNYLPNVWQHTWSLAVEEHFYIAVCILIWLGIKFNVLEKRSIVIPFLLLCLVLAFFLRWKACLPHKNDAQYFFFQTHLRMDGILTGLLLAYLYYFTSLVEKLKRKRAVVLAVALGLISPAFILNGGNFWMNTIGISMLVAGFAFLVILATDEELANRIQYFGLARQIYRSICFIGIHSYCIYIWHLIAQRLSFYIVDGQTAIGTFVYILFAITLGIFFSLIIEKPFLRLREFVLKKRICS